MADHAGEEVGEKALGVAQERALTLRAAQLLEEGEGQDLRVRKSLEGLVTLGAGKVRTLVTLSKHHALGIAAIIRSRCISMNTTSK